MSKGGHRQGGRPAVARSHGLPPPRSPGRPQPRATRPGQAYDAAKAPRPSPPSWAAATRRGGGRVRACARQCDKGTRAHGQG
eukprot:1878915-Alexandrium_andersonii.AAC.1